MKYSSYFFPLLFILITSLESKVIKQNRINSSIIEIFTTFSPMYTPEEQELLQHLNPYDIKNGVKTLNTLGQKYFLRPGHLSRLEPHELTEYYLKTLFPGCSLEEIKSLCISMYELFAASEYLQPILPAHKNPESILILGSTIMNMWDRITFFNDLIEKGIITLSESTKIIILVGERPLLDYEVKDLERLQQEYSTTLQQNVDDERTAGQIIARIFPFSDKVKKNLVHIVTTEKKPHTPRATTADTIDAWMKSDHFNKNNILVVSNNPYVEYQRETVLLSLISHNLAIEESSLDQIGFGSRLTPTTFTIKDIGIYLDNLARTLYTLNKIYEIIPPSNYWAMKYLYDLKTRIFYFLAGIKKRFKPANQRAI